ncbi:MAG: IS607 family transposase [Gammaproteobacteria bacterium]|jgi:predicted site-specific integrase-resolvase|nr:IS607 family transposase [Gammaproteobacteria bacterium]
MKLSVWAELQGISYKTAWRMWKAKTLPVPAYQLATGTVVVDAKPKASNVALYARVSSSDQKDDLDRQLSRLTQYAVSNKLVIVDVVKEIGSGLNGHRRNMLRLLSNPDITAIVVEHRERLVRFGFEYVEAALAAQNRKIIVIEPDEMTDDIVRDLHEVIVSMCARLYGKRSAKHRAQKALDAMQQHQESESTAHE